MQKYNKKLIDSIPAKYFYQTFFEGEAILDSKTVDNIIKELFQFNAGKVFINHITNSIKNKIASTTYLIIYNLQLNDSETAISFFEITQILNIKYDCKIREFIEAFVYYLTKTSKSQKTYK